VHIFIYIHYIQKYWQTVPVQLSLHTVKHKTKLYLELHAFFCTGKVMSVNAHANQM